MSASDPVFTVAAIREIENQYLPNAQPSLMERAGAAAAKLALTLLHKNPGPVLILAGPGNNGGDGFVLARHLLLAGHAVTLVFANDPEHLPSDAHTAFMAWQAAGGKSVQDFPPGDWALAVDALFGIGLHRAPIGWYADWIERFNRLTCPRLSIDIPSGLDADTGQAFVPCVKASHTLSFIGLKPGLLTLDGPDHCGEISIATLDLPLDAHSSPGRKLHPADFAAGLQARPRNTHKGHWGEVGIIGGAPGMLGAALLAGRAALKTGAGRVFVGCLDSSAPPVDLNHPELMLRASGDLHSIASVLALGPGLGQTEAAHEQLRCALQFDGPLVLDADALNLLSANPHFKEQILARKAPSVLTPHPAEAARLLATDTASIQSDRLVAAIELAEGFGAHVVLKGNGSVIAHPDGNWAINPTGHAGMAAAGMGDVLTGLAASLLGQGWPAGSALEGAVHLHGAAAELLAEEGVGPVGVSASELIPAARRLLNRWIIEYGAH
ncbi:MAG: NAD(P)H-hydrate dehydratase [Betaproteobacteria bacterium]|nr:NAD(P)H-hydrate dehydratase [Betaproteobacteria bacterium]